MHVLILYKKRRGAPHSIVCFTVLRLFFTCAAVGDAKNHPAHSCAPSQRVAPTPETILPDLFAISNRAKTAACVQRNARPRCFP
jgi:hypothetical protein